MAERQMKKKLLPLAILAASAELAGTARPVYAPGLGEVLIYPFYEIDGDVAVHMLEDDNAQQVTDFNLYLSPMDNLEQHQWLKTQK